VQPYPPLKGATVPSAAGLGWRIAKPRRFVAAVDAVARSRRFLRHAHGGMAPLP
jgi:hypothetical protein